MKELLQPKEVTVKTQEGSERVYILSKLDAISGRELVAQYPVSMLPKVGDYEVNEKMMQKLLSHVAVKMPDGTELCLTTKDLIRNHVPDWETLARLEIGMVEYNCSFFKTGLTSVISKTFQEKAHQFISKILTDLLAQSSRKDAPPSTN